MEPTFLFFLIIPVIIMTVFAVLGGRNISIIEGIVQIIAPILIVSLIWGITRYGAADDVELLNGQVVALNAQREECQSGWRSSKDPFCTEYRTREVYVGESCSGTGKEKVCTKQYDTEYKYIFDWERRYFIKTSFKTHEVRRIDRQGVNYPPVFLQTKVGEYAVVQHSYQNWLRAASNVIFSEDGGIEEKYKDILPQYPIKIVNMFKVNRIVPVGNVTVPDDLNVKLGQLLTVLGPERQMNAIIVIADAKTVGEDFPYAVRRAWYGFKKNDAVIFLGLNDNNLAWASVMSWSKKSIFDIELRDKILELRDQPVDYDFVLTNLNNIAMSSYERRSMKEFEYLKKEIKIPTLTLVLSAIISFFVSIGLGVFFSRN